MNPDVYTEPFDFALYPFALGDTMTWCVRSAIRALAAGCHSVDVMVCVDPRQPHNCFQDRPTARQYELIFSEVLPAFYTHPLLRTLMIFHDRDEFNRMLAERAQTGSLPAAIWNEYRSVYAQRDNFEIVSGYFYKMLSEQTSINQHYEKTGSIPWLREVIGCQADVEGLIQAQGKDARIVTLQFRLRNLDKAIVANDFSRDADYYTWERFLQEANVRHPHVRFMLLGRLQEKPLSLLQLPNVVTPRLLGFTLGHELSLLMRSHLYFGSSSGFAQCAHFSQAPYRIFNISPSACSTYGIPYPTDRLPFARPNQRLVYGKESADQLLATLDEALAEVEATETAQSSPRTARAGLTNAYPDDATTFRFIPDLRQAKYEIALLSHSSLARIKHNLNHGLQKDAEVELNQLCASLAHATEQLAPTASPDDPPTLREWARYWWYRTLQKPYHQILRYRGTRVNFRNYTSANSFAPRKWTVNGTLERMAGLGTARLRFTKDAPTSSLKSEPFRMRRVGALKLVFQAKRPRGDPQRSNIYLFENGRFRVVATPLYTRQWTTYAFEFSAMHDAELNVQFDNDMPAHWIYLRKIFVGNARKPEPSDRPALS